MARPRAQSASVPRFLSPMYYLRRPRRLLILFAFFVCSTYFLWDRHNLVVHQEETVKNLTRQNDKLQQKLEKLTDLLTERGESLPNELEFQEQENSGSKGSEQGLPDKTKKPALTDVDKDPVAAERRDKVKGAMLHAWTSYEKYAWGMDELKPQSKVGVNQFAGLGASIIDSLDTLYIMGFQKQFEKARDWVAENLDFNKNVETSVFETTIRVLGGLLSTYDLSGERMFLNKAQQIADRLLPAWETPSGIPYNTINLASGHASNPGWTGVYNLTIPCVTQSINIISGPFYIGNPANKIKFLSTPIGKEGSSILADSGTEQVELIALSQRTGIPKYKEKAERAIHQLRKVYPSDGLLSYYISPDTGQPTYGKITFGAMGDSFYEYLLKVWVMGNKTEVVKHYREMWEQSMEGMIKNLIMKTTSPPIYTYIAERSGNQLIHKMDELACFTPGMLVLGMEGASSEKAKEYLNLAEELANTCYNMYASTRSKLAGENYNFHNGRMEVGVSWNIMRPETIESLMYLWRKTGDQKYRDWGWDIFQAFESQTRVPSGFTGLRDVNSGEKDDMMQSFFLAETLKYLYLLFSPSTVIPLDEWVFNTEAHPVRIVPRMDEPVSLEEPVHKPLNAVAKVEKQQQRWKRRGGD